MPLFWRGMKTDRLIFTSAKGPLDRGFRGVSDFTSYTNFIAKSTFLSQQILNQVQDDNFTL